MKTRFLSAFLCALGLSAGAAIARPPDSVVRPIEEAREDDHATFEIRSTALDIQGDPEAAEVHLAGFDAIDPRQGAPDLPRRTVLVAIPPDATPVLEVQTVSDKLLPGIVPRATLTRTAASDGVEESILSLRVPSPEVFAKEQLDVAWLGKTGTFRDQRYVEVHVAPVRFDPKVEGLRFADRFQVTVRFDGDRGIRSVPVVEPLFEDVYRKTFVNYAQGTTFRLSATSPAAGFEATESAAFVSSARYRIRVRQNGIVRLDYAFLSPTPFGTESLTTYKLQNRGVEVPLEVKDDGDGVLEAGEWVQFYGQKLDDEPKTVLNTDVPNGVDLFEARDFTDENVYFLTVEAGARSRMVARAVIPTNTRTPPANFEAVTHVETDDSWRPLGAADPWYWLPALCIGTCSGGPVPSRQNAVALPGLASGTLPIRVVERTRGLNQDDAVYPDHRIRVSLLNASLQPLGSIDDDGTFDGRTIYDRDFTWTFPGAGAQASDPVNVKVEVLSSGTVSNQAILDWIDVRYRRSFAAAGDALLFDWPNADAEFVVTGLTASTPSVYEITDRVGSSGVVSAVRLTGFSVSGVGPYSIRFRMDKTASLPDQAPRRFVVAGPGAIAVPAGVDFTMDTVSNLRSTSNQADLIVIAHPSVVDTSPSSAFSQFLALRASQGITSKVALIEDVQDEFNDGLAGPVAIKSFLAWVLSTAPGEGWASPKPSYVLLLGDASYSYKGGTAAGNYLPTQILFKNDPQLGYYSADNVLAAVVGNDSMADFMVGRISSRTAAETNLVLQKVLDYEQNPPAGSWRHHAILISDRGKQQNPEEAHDFEAINDACESSMKKPPFSSRKLRYWSDFCSGAPCPYPTAANAMRSAIMSAVNGTDGFSDGAAVVQYTGHGNFDWWSDDAFFDDFVVPRDTSSLVNGGRLPWLMVHTCLTGGFHTTSDHSMGEDWLKRSGGGAIAVFAPSGLDLATTGAEVGRVVWNDIYGRYKRTDVATTVLDALVELCLTLGSIDTCQHYSYLGDPTLDLALPRVGPPGVPVAVAASLHVDLTWAASATPGVAYDVYRATKLAPEDYVRANASPIAGTAFSDTGVVNTKRYYYYVVATDALGYDSRWSNCNSDCAVSGPDCVQATPMNPNPPSAPTGVVVVDTERGGNLTVSWSQNPEPDIKNYTVRIGTFPGSYPISFDAGSARNFGVVGLTNGVTYYVVVTATNTSLHTSGPSTEKSAVPTSIQGLRPPGFVRTLHVNRSGGNAILTWGAVTLDIYGKPETVATYEVFRGPSPSFLPSLANRIGTSATPTFTDTGAITLPGAAYYLVRAVDSEGNVGGLGNPLPDGIEALRVGRAVSPSADLVLTWSAVTHDVEGGLLPVDHYVVYVSTQPFTRAQIRDGLILPFTSTTGTSIQLAPAAVRQYYSVLAVDARGNVSPF